MTLQQTYSPQQALLLGKVERLKCLANSRIKRASLPELHPGQETIVNEATRFNVGDCGRRFGKTKLGVWLVAQDDVLPHPVGWFSPTYKMLIEVWREAKNVLRPIIERKSEQEKRIEVAQGGVVEFWSLDNPDVARGRKYKRIIVDEAAMIKDLLSVWNLVLRPTLADLQGDAWFFSTPKGMNGYWQMYQWGLDELMPDWSCWQMPTSINPYIPDSEIEAMKNAMPERVYQQEILAMFLDDAGGVFRGVMDAATAVPESSPHPAGQYIIGVDWGKHHDFTVLTVINAANRSVVHLDRFNQIDYTVQVNRLVALHDRFKPDAIIAERNSMGDPLIEQLQRRGLPVYPFNTTNATKTRAIDELSLAFERGEIKVINDPVLIGELQAYEMERLPSGLMRYNAPAGMHDDCVMSLAIGWQGLMEMTEPSAGGVVTDHEPITISPY